MDRHQLASWLESRFDELQRHRVVTGFDGFVDEMLSVVETRQDRERYAPVATISQFGQLVSAAAGHSSLREVVVTAVHPGGCAVNMGDGLAALGVSVDTFATVGEPIHPAFAAYGRIARLHSWGPTPGRTLALEFDDGKLMLSDVDHLSDFTREHVEQRLQEGAYTSACEQASLIALTDWTLYPHMTDIWRLLGREVFAYMKQPPQVLIDLVDPSSRSDEDVHGMIEALAELATNARLTLGLNQNEANVLARLLGIVKAGSDEPGRVLEQASSLRDRLKIEEVVVHTHRLAALAGQVGETIAVAGPFTHKPLKSTGAGDRFNAGYAAGLVLGLPPKERLLMATTASGAFVRLARSASRGELVSLLRNADEWPSESMPEPRT